MACPGLARRHRDEDHMGPAANGMEAVSARRVQGRHPGGGVLELDLNG